MIDTPSPTTRGLPSRFRSFELTFGVVLVGAMTLLIVTSPFFFPDGGMTINLAARLKPPFVDPNHFLGTDPIGRDVLARIAVGGKVSLLVGIVSVLGAVVVGTAIGLVAGYYRSVIDLVLMRVVDIQLALPFVLMALTFIAIFGPGLTILIVLMVASQWVQYARLVRGLTLSLREREFVQSARAIGVKSGNIILVHILPNAIGPIVVLMTLNVATNILLESSLTFVGLGVDPTVPSWGGMLADGRTYVQSAWWVTVFPGLGIMFIVLGLNLFGDWLRDYLDPQGPK